MHTVYAGTGYINKISPRLQPGIQIFVARVYEEKIRLSTGFREILIFLMKVMGWDFLSGKIHTSPS